MKEIDIPRIKRISQEAQEALKQFQLRYERGIRQKTVRDFSTKDNPGTLPVYVYEDEPEASKIDFLQTCDPPVSTVSSIAVNMEALL